MGILGLGVDVVHVPRITSLIARRGPSKLVSRILSPSEISDWCSLPASSIRGSQFLAVRWGVKEAAYKALYHVVRPTWKELTYKGLRNGTKPSLEYTPEILDLNKKVGKIYVSVSHDGEYVFASVLVEDP